MFTRDDEFCYTKDEKLHSGEVQEFCGHALKCWITPQIPNRHTEKSYVSMFSGLHSKHIPRDIHRDTNRHCGHKCAGNHVPLHISPTL